VKAKQPPLPWAQLPPATKGKHGTTPNQLYLPGPGRILGAQYTLPKDDGTFGSLSGLAVLEDGRLGFTEFALAKW